VQNEQLSQVAEELKLVARVEKEATARINETFNKEKDAAAPSEEGEEGDRR
jgi:hypothetical protein